MRLSRVINFTSHLRGGRNLCSKFRVGGVSDESPPPANFLNLKFAFPPACKLRCRATAPTPPGEGGLIGSNSSGSSVLDFRWDEPRQDWMGQASLNTHGSDQIARSQSTVEPDIAVLRRHARRSHPRGFQILTLTPNFPWFLAADQGYTPAQFDDFGGTTFAEAAATPRFVRD